MRTIRFFFSAALLIIAAVALIICVAGCGQKAAIEKQKNFVRQIVENKWNKRNLNLLDELYSDGFICHNPPYGDKSLDSLKKTYRGFHEAYPDVKFNIEAMVAEGDKVTVLATYSGTDRETGKKVSGPGLLMFRWKDGKIAESWEIWDELGYWQQLGYKMIPPITKTTFARVTITQGKPEKTEERLKIYRESLVPEAKKQKGFRGITLLSDFKTGKGISISIWDTEADAIANEQSRYYKAQVDKFKDSYTAKPVREGYVVTVQE